MERVDKSNAQEEAAELRAAAAAPAPKPAAPEPAAPGSGAQEDPAKARIVAAVAKAMRGQLSSNSSTNRFNAAVAAMGPEKFKPQGKQTLENWLRSAVTRKLCGRTNCALRYEGPVHNFMH